MASHSGWPLLCAALVLGISFRSRWVRSLAAAHVTPPRRKSSLSQLPALPSASPAASAQFQVLVSVDRFKFTAAHFIAFEGFRERMHGHNYSVSVRIIGSHSVASDGYVIDFGDVKATVSDVCKRMNEHFLFPSKSPVLTVLERSATAFRFVCTVDGCEFSLPPGDVLELPLVHSSAEEIAEYLWHVLVHDAFTREKLEGRGVTGMEIGVAEAPNQVAFYKRGLDAPALRLDGERTVPCRVCSGCLSPLSPDPLL